MRAFYLTILSLILLWSPSASAQKNKASRVVDISVTVVDGKGECVPAVSVSVGEGVARYTADNNGMVAFKSPMRELVTFSKEGYASVTMPVSVLLDTDNVVLTQDVLFAGNHDDVFVPHSSVKKRYMVGSSVTISGEELARYSSSDIRNALTGVLPGVNVVENFGQVGMSPLEHIGQYGAATAVSVTTRGRQLMYMVDDVPVNIDETPLAPDQIESVTIVRDVVDKTLYGPTAADGIIYIRTKRGRYNERYLNVAYEGGVNVVDRMPQFVNASTYARLNNIARNNSGLAPLYSASDVLAYSGNDPYDKLHPSVNFSEMMLKNVMQYHRANVSSAGGNDIVRYQVFLGWNSQDDIYKIGPRADYNNVSLNGKVDVRLNKYIKLDFGVLSSIGIRRSGNYGYSSNYSSEDQSSNTTLGVAEFPDIISHITTIPQLSFPVYADNSETLESPWYAVSSKYTQNPIANILENGSYTETIRKALFNVGIDIDLSFITKGLSSYTYGAYDATNLVRLGKMEDYAAYIITTETDLEGNVLVVPQQSSSHSVQQMSSKTKLLDYFSSRFYLIERLKYDRTFGKHRVAAGADYMITKRTQKFITEPRREMNIGLDGSYSYDERYIARIAMNVHGTYSLLNPWSFSPTVGFGWIVSGEEFFRNVRNVDFLKLRLQGGLLNYDSLTSANRDLDNYSWNNGGQKFGPHTNNQWFGGDQGTSTNRTYASMLGNPDLRLERRYEAEAGLDLTAFDRRLDVSATYWYNYYDGAITSMTNVLPLIAGVSSGSMYMNWNKTVRQGFDLNFSWKHTVGDFNYGISGWASTLFSRIVRTDELDYDEDYRVKAGKSASAIWGLKYEGQFATDGEASSSGQMFDEELHAGDYRYKDMNGDGIVDDSDICVIGDSAPKLSYALTLNFGWKGLDLLITGTGMAFYDAQLTNSYFWNGWGDSNYSLYTLKHLNDPSSPELAYNKVNNNWKLSDKWLADGSYFKIQCLEIGYRLPVEKMKISGVLRNARVYLRANNLLTISGIRDVDPEALNSGLTNYPLMRTFVAGLKLTF